SLAGAIANEAFVVLQFDIVAVHVDGGEPRCAVRRNGRQGRRLIGHGTLSRDKFMTTAKRAESFMTPAPAIPVNRQAAARRSVSRCRSPAAQVASRLPRCR